MASSLKVSELNSLNQLSNGDLFLVSDVESSTSRKVSYSTLKNNITGQLSATVAQNRQDAEALVETVRSALQLAIDGNTSYSTETRSDLTATRDELVALINEKIGQLTGDSPELLNTLSEIGDALGDDPQFFSTMATANATLQSGIDALQAYVDAQIASDMWLFSNQSEFPSASDNHGRVVHSHADGAMFYAHGGSWHKIQKASDSDVLSSRLDTLESDPTTAAAVAAVQADVDANETAANTAISGLDGRIQSLESDPTTKTYVDEKVASVVDFAPEDLDTLNELAAALGDDPQIITTLQAQLDNYIAHVEARNLEAALAFGELYVDTLYGG